MRAVVTGGAGFVGSHLVDTLVGQGSDVLVIDDLSTGKRQNISAAMAEGAVLEELDVREGAPVRNLIGQLRPDVVFHLAAQMDVRSSVRDPASDARTNVEGTLNVLEAARRSECKRFVFASTGGAIYGDTSSFPTSETTPVQPMAPYGQSKACAESYLALYRRLYGLSSVSLRFGNVYGPRQDPHGEAGVVAIFAQCLLSGEAPTIFGTGRQTRDYIFVEDVVAGLLSAARSEAGGAINLGTEEETSVLEVLERLAWHAGVSVDPVLKPVRKGELERSCLDARLARDTLAWSARVSLDEGLKRTWAWLAGGTRARTRC